MGGEGGRYRDERDSAAGLIDIGNNSVLNLYRIAPAEDTFLTRPPRFFASLADNFTIKGQGAVNGAAAAWNSFRKIRRGLGAGSGGPAQPGLAHQINCGIVSSGVLAAVITITVQGSPHSGTAAQLGTAVRCCVAEPPGLEILPRRRREGGGGRILSQLGEQKC